MTKLALVTAASLLVVACTSEVETPPSPTSCQKTDRTGTYLFSYRVQSGNCPELPDTLVTLGPSANPSTTCTTHSEVWSEGDCKLAIDATCQVTGTDGTTSTVKAVSVTHQRTQDGSRLEGTYSVDISTQSGARCIGTYSITATRQ